MEQDEILKKLNENANDCVIKNRRKVKNDWLLQLINLISFIAWIVIIILLGLCDKAGIKLFDITQTVKGIYSVHVFKIVLLSTSILFFVSFVLLIASFKRSRRYTDKIKTSLLFSEIISFIIGMFLLMKLI